MNTEYDILNFIINNITQGNTPLDTIIEYKDRINNSKEPSTEHYVHMLSQMTVLYGTEDALKVVTEHFNIPHNIVPWSHYEHPLQLLFDEKKLNHEKIKILLEYWKNKKIPKEYYICIIKKRKLRKKDKELIEYIQNL